MTQQQLPATQDVARFDVSSLPLWQRRIIAAVQYGIPLPIALDGSNVSKASLDLWTRKDPRFAEALAAAEAGVAVMGVDQARQLAVARASYITEHVARKATEAEKDRDQVAFARLNQETAGLVGRPPPDETAKETARAFLSELVAMRRAAEEQERLTSPPIVPPSTAPDGAA